MAVSVQAPLSSNLGMWNSGIPQSAFSSTELDEVSSSMIDQSPLPPSGIDPGIGMIPSNHQLPREYFLDSPALQKPSSPVVNSRAATGITKSAKMKRSTSTPNVRGQAAADAAALALSAEKRRNKLGYHRTSVACGHCRRRKIRCIPAPADSQNRCTNCIRLKKDCNYHPVEQPPEEVSRGSSKTQSGTGRVSESSSPSTSSGQLPEMHKSLPYPHSNMPSVQDLGGPLMKRQRTGSFSPEAKVVNSSRNFEFGHGTTNWMAPDASPSVKSQAELPQSFWRPNPQESPLTPSFSPFTPNLQIPPHQNWPNTHPEASPRDDLSWPVPTRSISYGNLEGLQGQHQFAPYQHPVPHSNHSNSPSEYYTTKPRELQPGMYPHSISTSTGVAHAAVEPSSATNGEPQHVHSAGALPPHYPQWQQPYAYNKPVVPGADPYGTWPNSHAGQNHMLVEGHAPPIYSYGEPVGGAYYSPLPSNHAR